MQKRTFTYERGGATASPDKAEQMRKKILSALQGGASDKEIMTMVRESGLQDEYEFNWDNVEMKVEVHKLPAKKSFGPKDPPGQRGDMFAGGGTTGNPYEEYQKKLREYNAILSRTGLPEEQYQKYSKLKRDLMASHKETVAESRRLEAAKKQAPEAANGIKTYEEGGKVGGLLDDLSHMPSPKTYAGQYMGKIQEDEGGKFAEYEELDGSKIKAYFMEDPGEVGEYVPDNDYLFEEVDGKMTARLAEGFEDQRNPKERQIGKEVMEESTKGASKVENLLEKLMDAGRGGANGTRTFRY